jgi:hypothetical protein
MRLSSLRGPCAGYIERGGLSGPHVNGMSKGDEGADSAGGCKEADGQRGQGELDSLHARFALVGELAEGERKTRLPRVRDSAGSLVDGRRFHDLGRHRSRAAGLHRQLGN